MKTKAKACDIYDGDTFGAVFNYNGKLIKYRCRCLGYDSPEMKPAKSKPNHDNEVAMAKAAKQRFTELLQKSRDGLITIECGKFEKYGRLLVTVYNGVDKMSVNQIMINEGHGRPYDGGKKEDW
jgi:endonuclease YncB( thermonuclease family)